MNEYEVMDQSQGEGPVTRPSLEADLRQVFEMIDGTVPSVLAHTSLSSMGWVCGGEQTLLEALLAAADRKITLVMPAFTSQLTEPSYWVAPPAPKEWWPTIREQLPPFDPMLSPVRGLGRLPELFRNHPASIRSSHPHVSFAASGPHALSFLASHPLDDGFGMKSPLGALYRENGWVLMLGTKYSSCTTLHLAERLADFPGKWWREEGAPIRNERGKRAWVKLASLETEVGVDDFDDLGEAFEASEPDSANFYKGKIARATVRLIRARTLVDFAVTWFEENRATERDEESP